MTGSEILAGSQPAAFQQVNQARFRPGNGAGHYESYFQRANHPTRPLAFWIRYTVFNPKGRPQEARGQLWAIYFDGETDRITAVKEEFPIQECSFSTDHFAVQIGRSSLDNGSLQGNASHGGNSIAWNLTYGGDQRPLFLIPQENYGRKFPSAKALVALPFANYCGTLQVNEDSIVIEDWVGSQNHNWGSKHTDQYAWGQVAGFDNDHNAFLECATVRLKVGPVWTPWLTNVVLRLGDQEYALNTIRQGLRARGSYDYFTWSFRSENEFVRIAGTIEANRDHFVGLVYENPPGGIKHCLNTKIGKCWLVVERDGQEPVELYTESRAAFEIVTDDDKHGIAISA